MTAAQDNSSLPLLLTITGAVVAVAVGGWFFLDQQEPVPSDPQNPAIVAPATTTVANIEDVPLENPETAVEQESQAETDTTVMPSAAASPDVDAELRKARLASDADILVFPPEQSALYYYGRVLESDPQHAIAIAELDAILTSVAQTVAQHLVAEEYDDAYAIAVLVAKQDPEHSLVVDTQQTLDDYTEQLVEQAISHAREANDDKAVQALATAESLPGRNPDYFTAVRESIAEIRNVRVAAERDRVRRAQLAETETKAAWIENIQSAIAQGNLIFPAGASAVDVLAETNKWAAEREQMTSELLSALVDTAQSNIDAELLIDAEALLNAAVELSGEPDGFDELRVSLENAFVAAKSNRIAQVAELVYVKTVSPRYPRLAMKRNLSGWVDVYFTVTPSGETADITVNQSDPESVFDRAAIAAVENWQFQPVEYRGQVIPQRVGARLVFRLE